MIDILLEDQEKEVEIDIQQEDLDHHLEDHLDHQIHHLEVVC